MVWYNKENPAKRVNGMNIGEKIKRIRQHRRMTQKELGELVDLSANRIAQYEMGYRVPKKPLLNQIAEALRVSPLALSDGGNGPANDILEQLFWLDEEQPALSSWCPPSAAQHGIMPTQTLRYTMMTTITGRRAPRWRCGLMIRFWMTS